VRGTKCGSNNGEGTSSSVVDVGRGRQDEFVLRKQKTCWITVAHLVSGIGMSMKLDI